MAMHPLGYRMREPVLTKQGTDDEMALAWHLSHEGGVLQVAVGVESAGELDVARDRRW